MSELSKAIASRRTFAIISHPYTCVNGLVIGFVKPVRAIP